jgi:hypothetical protein
MVSHLQYVSIHVKTGSQHAGLCFLLCIALEEKLGISIPQL